MAGRPPPIWPATGDINASYLRGGKFNFVKAFREIVRKKTLFLVTDFDELNKQPELEAKLSTYPIYAEGEGYIMYRLHQKK